MRGTPGPAGSSGTSMSPRLARVLPCVSGRQTLSQSVLNCGWCPKSSLIFPVSSDPTGTVPWSDPCLPELPFPSPFWPQALGQPPGGDSYFPDLFLAPCAQATTRQPSPGPSQLPAGARPGVGPSLSRAPEDPPPPPSAVEQHLALEEGREEDKDSQVP